MPNVQPRPPASMLMTAAIVLTGALGAPPAGLSARAQGAEASVPAAQPTIESLLTDFVHYVKIDQKELAASFGRAILERGLKPADFVGIVEDTPQAMERFDEAVRDAMRDPALEEVGRGLFRLYEQGRLDRARDPGEVTRNIALLDQNQRARLLARQRLAYAGEYATPQLLEALSGSSQIAQVEAQELLVAMGSDAVAPLSAAITGVEPALQERLARILGRIGQSAALPALLDVRAETQSAAVRSAAERAIREIDPTVDPGASPAAYAVALGERYYDESDALTRHKGETHQLLWSYEPGLGLIPTPIVTSVFHEAMAMRLAERALQRDARVDGAAPLWIAANFSREFDQPAEYANPAYGADRRDAMYYAVAAGSAQVERVLDRAMRDRDTALARQALEALSRTAGGQSLLSGASEDRPLVRALTYPDRRVNVEAALAIVRANPSAAFPGSERVAPILGAAIRDAGARFAVVIAEDAGRRSSLQELLTGQGYTVLAPGARLGEVMDVVSEAPGVDLIVSDLPTATQTAGLIEEARSTLRLAATPIVALVPQGAFAELGGRFDGDETVRLARAGISDEQLSAASAALVESASGPAIGAEQAESYSLRALAALRDMAVSGSSVFRVTDAMAPLLSAIPSAEGRVRLDIADVLAHVAEPQAQQAVVETALGASGEDRVALLGIAADSARRFGNQLPDRLVQRLVETASSPDNGEATAAAALMGALNLPNDRIIPLILGR